jgi:hypothetical protein
VLDFNGNLQEGIKSSATFPRLTLRVRSPSPALLLGLASPYHSRRSKCLENNTHRALTFVFLAKVSKNMDTSANTIYAGAADNTAYAPIGPIASVCSGSILTRENVRPLCAQARGGFFICIRARRGGARQGEARRGWAWQGEAFRFTLLGRKSGKGNNAITTQIIRKKKEVLKWVLRKRRLLK